MAYGFCPSAEADSAQSVAVFLPQTFFRDDEFQTVTMALEKAGFNVVVTAAETTVVKGIDGLLVRPQRLLRDISPQGFVGLVLINGPGAAVYWDDKELHKICQEFVSAERVVAAIGTSPIILAKAGVLSGKKATAFPDRRTITILKENGCQYRFGPVVRDGNILTANRSENCFAFVRALIKMLTARLPG
ncbi:MAG: DJ-1/PfpI family protein [candidate division WOR-3 bacterium]